MNLELLGKANRWFGFGIFYGLSGLVACGFAWFHLLFKPENLWTIVVSFGLAIVFNTSCGYCKRRGEHYMGVYRRINDL